MLSSGSLGSLEVDALLPSLTIFFPCYNDEGTIDQLVEDAFSVGFSLTDDLEVIVVEDGSIDGSRRVLERLRSKYDQLRLVYHERNRGYGAALRSGFEAATSEWVFYTDGDGQYDVNDLHDLVPFTENADVVNGQKISRSDSWYRIWIGKVYAKVVGEVFELPIADIDCHFRLIRTALVKQLDLTADSGAICVELISGLAGLGARFEEVPVVHYSRQFGRSQFFQIRRIIRTLYQLNQIRSRLREGGRPDEHC